MRFIIPINDADANDETSQTVDIVETSSESRRTNRRKLREYFAARGVLTTDMKKVFKSMGFEGKRLGTKK